jgi:hypothetical protein
MINAAAIADNTTVYDMLIKSRVLAELSKPKPKRIMPVIKNVRARRRARVRKNVGE